ncbi:hypothetical protein DM860_007884 [Cuscuta australis]|uniref:N-acetyl-D-glucosamine kinase n=1 Tax=Cuscuta australis TaxID=267555 RepID=A0A328DYA9_9ASTE|nr:hypothetical protein DM860_007884 [Cuscuta australis]
MGSESNSGDVILGVDGGATSTVCVCLPLLPLPDIPDPLPVLGRAIAGCSNQNSVGEQASKETLLKVMEEALSNAGIKQSHVRAVCLGLSGINHPIDQEKMLNWLRNIFPSDVKLYVRNDAVAALASGTMGKLSGCVLIAGTGSICYGFTEDGREARAAGAGPVLGDWGSGYGIAAKGLSAVMRAHDGRGPETMLTSRILRWLSLSSPEELIRWTYADLSWARIAAIVPVVVSCAEDGDVIANEILNTAVNELAVSVRAVVQRLCLAGKDDNDSFPLVMVGGVLEANQKWNIGNEVINSILKTYPRASIIRPKVEPAVGAALLAMNLLLKEAKCNGHR